MSGHRGRTYFSGRPGRQLAMFLGRVGVVALASLTVTVVSTRLGSASLDGSINGVTITEFERPVEPGFLTLHGLSSDGRFVLWGFSNNDGQSLRRRNLVTGEDTLIYSGVSSGVMSADGSVVVLNVFASEPAMAMWREGEGESARVFLGRASVISISDDGRFVLYRDFSQNSYPLRVWDVESNGPLPDVAIVGAGNNGALMSGDGSSVVISVTPTGLPDGSWTDGISRYDVATGEWEHFDSRPGFRLLDVSTSGRYVVGYVLIDESVAPNLHVWGDLDTGRFIEIPRSHVGAALTNFSTEIGDDGSWFLFQSLRGDAGPSSDDSFDVLGLYLVSISDDSYSVSSATGRSVAVAPRFASRDLISVNATDDASVLVFSTMLPPCLVPLDEEVTDGPATTSPDPLVSYCDPPVPSPVDVTSLSVEEAEGPGIYIATRQDSTVAGPPVRLPGPPRSVSTRAGSRSATVSWLAPADNGGSGITGYYVRVTPGGRVCRTSGTSCTIGGLTPGASYSFELWARNLAGWGTPTPLGASVRIPPVCCVARPSHRSAVVTWVRSAWSSLTSLVRYEIEVSTNGGATWQRRTSASPTATSLSIGQLENGRSYRFRVRAVSAGAIGAWFQTDSVVPRTVPSQARGVTATVLSNRLIVRWSAPSSNGGSPITGYLLQTSSDGTNWSTAVGALASSRAASLSAFTSRTRYVRVISTNAAGLSAPTRVRIAGR